MKETTGQSWSLTSGSFSLVSMFEITAPLSYSLPVAAMVLTVMRGKASVTRLLSSTRSQAGPSCPAAAQIAFEASIVKPPPTATTRSTPSARQRAAARSTDVTRGLGSIPENSTTRTPAASRALRTASSSPLRRTLPPPVTTSAVLYLREVSSSAMWSATAPTPK